MPSVLYHGRPGQTYTLGLDGLTHFFRAGEVVRVPESVAIRCQEIHDHRGNPAFDVWGIDGNPDRDVEEFLGVQLEWDLWQ